MSSSHQELGSSLFGGYLPCDPIHKGCPQNDVSERPDRLSISRQTKSHRVFLKSAYIAKVFQEAGILRFDTTQVCQVFGW